MCDEKHPFVLPKRFFVKRKLAEGTVTATDQLSPTNRFPGEPEPRSVYPPKTMCCPKCESGVVSFNQFNNCPASFRCESCKHEWKDGG